jgi:hypothetical protein
MGYLYGLIFYELLKLVVEVGWNWTRKARTRRKSAEKKGVGACTVCVDQQFGFQGFVSHIVGAGRHANMSPCCSSFFSFLLR